MSVPLIHTLCVGFVRLFMALNKLLVRGIINLLYTLPLLAFGVANLTPLYSCFIVVMRQYIFFLYVDDIILTTSSQALVAKVISCLSAEFAMTDLGQLSYFLGIVATRSSSGLFLSQSSFAREILIRTDMASCNPCLTPADTKSKLSSFGNPVSDPTMYRSLASALQYLTFSRPNIAYTVQKVCLHMS